MNWREIVRTHLPEITGDPTRDEEIVDELSQHLAAQFGEAQSAGASAEEARAMTIENLHNSAQLRRAIVEASLPRPSTAPPPPSARGRLLQDVGADCKYALRLLRRAPGFTTAALLTMALGIGMTTAIFSVLQAVLLRPIPFPDADRLVMVWETDRSSGTVREPASVPDFIDFAERSREVDRLAAFGSYEASVLVEGREPTRRAALAISTQFATMLGIRTIAGRAFSRDEYRPRGQFVIVISERLWTTLFSRRASAIGSSITINERPATVVGVVPDTTDFGVLQILSSAANARGFADRDVRTRVDIWSPLQADPATASREGHGLLMIGRLAPGVTVASAQDGLSRIASDLERAYSSNRSRGIFVEPLRDVIVGRVQTPLAVLTGAVVLVLLISWVNVANLLLARGSSRMREIAVRTALGAEPLRLLRQFAVENVLLMMMAGALGLAVAYGALTAVIAIAPATIPRLADATLDARVMSLALGVSVCVGLTFGFFAMTQVRPNAPLEALNIPSGGGPRSHGTGRLRSVLVVVEVAMAVVALSAAGLLVRSFWLIQQTDPGFDVNGVLKAEFQLPPSRYPVDFRSAAPGYVAFNSFSDTLLQRVAALPAVKAVALVGAHPFSPGGTTSFEVVGRESQAENWPELPVRGVTPGYFAVMRVPHRGGRLLTETDTSTSARVVVINQALAERFFPAANPLGHKLRFYGSTEWTIVGIVGNERFQGITNAAPIAAYVLLGQAPVSTPSLLVRTAVDPVSAVSATRTAIAAVDPALAVFAVESLAETLTNSVAQQRFLMVLLGLLAIVALTLAAIGVHGVLSYLVAQRTKEIGIRISVGADARQIMHLVFGQGMRFITLGLAAGVGLTFAASRSLAGLLFEIGPTDAITLSGVVLVISVVAALSLWLPARRAVKIDPLVALRQG